MGLAGLLLTKEGCARKTAPIAVSSNKRSPLSPRRSEPDLARHEATRVTNRRLTGRGTTATRKAGRHRVGEFFAEIAAPRRDSVRGTNAEQSQSGARTSAYAAQARCTHEKRVSPAPTSSRRKIRVMRRFSEKISTALCGKPTMFGSFVLRASRGKRWQDAVPMICESWRAAEAAAWKGSWRSRGARRDDTSMMTELSYDARSVVCRGAGVTLSEAYQSFSSAGAWRWWLGRAVHRMGGHVLVVGTALVSPAGHGGRLFVRRRSGAVDSPIGAVVLATRANYPNRELWWATHRVAVATSNSDALLLESARSERCAGPLAESSRSIVTFKAEWIGAGSVNLSSTGCSATTRIGATRRAT